MATRCSATIQELVDIQNESMKVAEDRCIERLIQWFEARKFCRTPEAARRLAEQILSGNTEALADE